MNEWMNEWVCGADDGWTIVTAVCLCVVSGLVQSVTDVISSVIIVSRRHHVTSRDQQLYLRQGGCFSRRSLLAEISWHEIRIARSNSPWWSCLRAASALVRPSTVHIAASPAMMHHDALSYNSTRTAQNSDNGESGTDPASHLEDLQSIEGTCLSKDTSVVEFSRRSVQ